MNIHMLLTTTFALLILGSGITPIFAELDTIGNEVSETTVATSDVPVKILGLPYQVGDVFAGTGGGMIDVYRPDGTFVQTLDTTSASTEQTGMCFRPDGTMYATSFTTSTATYFDSSGNVITHPFANFNLHGESCVVDAAGNIYFGQADGTSDILKYAPDGTLLDNFDVATTARGSDWIDLAADQCTMFYTSEGSTIKRYDVCSDTQLADFATGLPAPCFALRIRDNGEVMVACRSSAFQINPDGTVGNSYPAAGFSPPSGFLFALNLDPDGTSFWTADIGTGRVHHIDIATGNQLGTFVAPPRAISTAGLAVFGEPTVAVCPPGTHGTPPNCIPDNGVVGGEFLPISTTALILAGVQTNAAWILTALAGIASAAFGALYLTSKRN